jgi:protein SCO1/2
VTGELRRTGASLGLGLALALMPVSALGSSDGEATTAPHEGCEHAGHEAAAASSDSQYARKLTAYRTPDVVLQGHDHQQHSLVELLDSEKPVMLNFIFTSCTTICPVMTSTFREVERQLGSDRDQVQLVSISIDPEHDSPEALSAYARRFGAGPQWEFLTGSLDDSIAVQQAFDADRGDKMNHAPLTLMRATPESQWVRYEGFATATELVRECRSML